MKYSFIEEHAHQYPVQVQCKVLEVHRSGYYKYRKQLGQASVPTQRQRENAAIGLRMKALQPTKYGVYGSRKLVHHLRREGFVCSRHRIRRIRQAYGLVARPRRAFIRTTESDHRLASANLLNRQFLVLLLNRVWVCDITYVPTDEGFLYVATVMDLCSRKIIGLAMGSELTSALTQAALLQAIAMRHLTPGLICHSDRGVQYSANGYRNILTAQHMLQSMSRKGNCWDNAPMESFYRSLKVEEVYLSHYLTREQAELAIFDFIHIFYNRQRLHEALNYQTPEEFEQALLKQQTTINHLTPRSTPTVY